MNLEITKDYSTYSTSIVLHLLHNSEDYNNIWKEKYPELSNQLNNFFKNENCGCRPPILQNYIKNRFHIDVFTVDFINSNDSKFDIENFIKEKGSQNLRGAMFVLDNNISSYQDFLASLQQKKASFNNFNAINIGDKIVVTFF